MGGIMGVLTSAFMGVISLVIIRTVTSELDMTGWSGTEKGLFDILPIVMCACVVLGVFGTLVGGPAAVTYVTYKKWEQFGIRLKLAYEAKFGYSNPAFNEEVDGLVLSMRSNSKGEGLTKEQNEKRLKRLARFVEVKFVIPEEERLAETEKTEMLARGYERAHQEFHIQHDNRFRQHVETQMQQDPRFLGQFAIGALAAVAASEGATKLEPRVEPKPEYKPDAEYKEEVYVPKPVFEPIIFIEPEKVAVPAVKNRSWRASSASRN
jgi:hypothetical protein